MVVYHSNPPHTTTKRQPERKWKQASLRWNCRVLQCTIPWTSGADGAVTEAQEKPPLHEEALFWWLAQQLLPPVSGSGSKERLCCSSPRPPPLPHVTAMVAYWDEQHWRLNPQQGTPWKTHLHLCENLSFLALLQAGPKRSHHVLLCSNHLHNFLVTLDTHGLEREEKTESVGFVLTHWHLLMLIWHCLWVLLPSKSQLFSQKRCHLALAARARAAREPEIEVVIRKRKTNTLKHFCMCTTIPSFKNILSFTMKKWGWEVQWGGLVTVTTAN